MQHAFPHDFRADMNISAWDPSKWYILLMQRFGLVWGLRRAREEDIVWAIRTQRQRDAAKAAGLDPDDVGGSETEDEAEPQEWVSSRSPSETTSSDEDAEWDLQRALHYAKAVPGRCVLVIDGYVVDATKFMGEHVRLPLPRVSSRAHHQPQPGGAGLIRNYALRGTDDATVDSSTTVSNERDMPDGGWREAGWAFHGGLNNHTRAAGRRLKQLRIARFHDIK